MRVDVYRDRADGPVLMGRFEGPDTHTATFTYDDAYLDWAMPRQQLGMSELLSLDFEPYAPAEYRPFVAGLLPEGSTLPALAQRYQVPRNDYLGLIAQAGCESIGALTFVADGVDKAEYQPGYRHLTPDDMAAFRDNPERAVALQSGQVRLSLSGAQTKVAWALPEDVDEDDAKLSDWLVPYGTAASTHIIKVARKGEEDVAENELACSVLARRCGVPTAQVTRITELPGGIAVKRYDRIWVGEGQRRHVARLHQEDLCQALGLMPDLKYQPTGLPTSYVALVCNLLDETSADAGADRVMFARRLVLDYALGNADNHLKNSSLLYAVDWKSRRLAPAYDITCIPLTGYSTRMAYDIGNHRVLSDITADDIVSVARELHVTDVEMVKVIAEVLGGLDIAKNDDLGGADRDVVYRILRNAAPRLAVLGASLRLLDG